jgi:hypothetical protein
MATIERVEILMVDLKPEVVRTDAIQSFARSWSSYAATWRRA